MWGHIGEDTHGKLDKDDDLYLPTKKQQQLHEIQFALYNCSFFTILDFNLSPKREKHCFHFCLQHHHEWAPWKPPYQRNEKRQFTASWWLVLEASQVLTREIQAIRLAAPLQTFWFLSWVKLKRIDVTWNWWTFWWTLAFWCFWLLSHCQIKSHDKW